MGNLYEAGVAAVPHPITATISLANDIGDLALPGDSSPLEHLGEIAAHGDRARMGEMVGGTISDYLGRSEEHTSELQSRGHLVCRLLLEKKKRLDSKLVHVSYYDYVYNNEQ